MLIFSMLFYYAYDFTLKYANTIGKMKTKSDLSPQRPSYEQNESKMS